MAARLGEQVGSTSPRLRLAASGGGAHPGRDAADALRIRHDEIGRAPAASACAIAPAPEVLGDLDRRRDLARPGGRCRRSRRRARGSSIQ